MWPGICVRYSLPAIDEGEVQVAGGDTAEPISEIELELNGGNAAALYDLALRLLEVAPIRIEMRASRSGVTASPKAGRPRPPRSMRNPSL